MIDENDIKDYGLSWRLFWEKIDPGIEVYSWEASPVVERPHKHKRCLCSHHRNKLAQLSKQPIVQQNQSFELEEDSLTPETPG